MSSVTLGVIVTPRVTPQAQRKTQAHELISQAVMQALSFILSRAVNILKS